MTTEQPLLTLLMAVLALGWAATASAHQFQATGQTTVCCIGDDGDIRAGKGPRYKDNGDGTVTDKITNLTWEKKSDDGTIHDVDNVYTWRDAFDVHVASLNAANFAGHNDWRLPSYKELASILDLETFNPAVSAAFNTNCVPNVTVLDGSCTAASNYWTSTTLASSYDTAAFLEDFIFGLVLAFDKRDSFRVRAVRGGTAHRLMPTNTAHFVPFGIGHGNRTPKASAGPGRAQAAKHEHGRYGSGGAGHR
jgi:hypothetical protein